MAIKVQSTTPQLECKIQQTYQLAKALATRKPEQAIRHFNEIINLPKTVGEWLQDPHLPFVLDSCRQVISLIGNADKLLADPHRFVTLAKCQVKLAELSPQDAELRAFVKEQLQNILGFAIRATEGSPCRRAIVLEISATKSNYDHFLTKVNKA